MPNGIETWEEWKELAEEIKEFHLFQVLTNLDTRLGMVEKQISLKRILVVAALGAVLGIVLIKSPALIVILKACL